MKKDLVGRKFNMLTVIREDGKDKNGRIMWLCKCDCGNYHRTSSKYLLNGDSTSCGCRRTEILKKQSELTATHRMTGTRIHGIWLGMKHRCENPKNSSYKNYGGRGIKVCAEWQTFINFYNWSITNGYAEDLTIDRINNDGNYEPSNCRWIDRKSQSNNTRKNHYLTYKGQTKSMSEWADIIGINYSTLRARINNYNWTVERALETR